MKHLALALLLSASPAFAAEPSSCPTPAELAEHMRAGPDSWPTVIIEGKQAAGLLAAINAAGKPTDIKGTTLVVGLDRAQHAAFIGVFDGCSEHFIGMPEDMFGEVLKKIGDWL